MVIKGDKLRTTLYWKLENKNYKHGELRNNDICTEENENFMITKRTTFYKERRTIFES